MGEFTEIWKGYKSELAECRTCEYRYICQGCRTGVLNLMTEKPNRANIISMKVGEIHSFLVFIFIFFSSPSLCQTSPPLDVYFWDSVLIEDIGKQMSTDTMSYNGYLLFLNRIRESDQKYREVLKSLDASKDRDKTSRVIKLMKINDKKNQIALLRLLEKFGWPCSNNWEYSLSAWVVVWHADISDRPPFFDYLKSGYKNKCLREAHYKSIFK